MAKSMRLHEFEGGENPTTTLQGGNFWEHWFDTQPSMAHPADNCLDEHRIWERAIHIGVLAGQKEKN